MTTLDVEILYHRTGIRVEGLVEMRQAWFFNDLKPRTYFALGGTLYFLSCYVQEIFNTLLDIFPVTHRIHRFDLSRLDVMPLNSVIIYDFSSFTSKMTEQRYFLDYLADFCDDIEVTILDTHKGLLNVSLGELIRDYNDGCNKEARFEIQEGLRELGEMADIVHCHKCAGFLGVYGNLASCTFLHGLLITMCTGSMTRCSCVGDDAIGVVEIEPERELEEGEIQLLANVDSSFEVLQSIGQIHPGKTKVLDPLPDIEIEASSDIWTYLKRSLSRDHDGLHLSQMLAFPSFALAYHRIIETTRRMRFELTEENVVHRLVSQTSALLRHIYHIQPPVSELGVVWDYLMDLYIEWRLPFFGYFKDAELLIGDFSSYSSCVRSCLFIPWLPLEKSEVDRWLTAEPVELLIRIYQPLDTMLPVLSRDRIVGFADSPGSSFMSTGSKLLSLLEDFGYITREACMELVRPADILQRIESFLDRSSFVVFRYTVVTSLPEWSSDVAQALL